MINNSNRHHETNNSIPGNKHSRKNHTSWSHSPLRRYLTLFSRSCPGTTSLSPHTLAPTNLVWYQLWALSFRVCNITQCKKYGGKMMVNQRIHNLFRPLIFLGCGSVQNNILRSPGYPNNYPSNIHCVYRVRIPLNKGLLISFNHFSLESHSRCG